MQAHPQVYKVWLKRNRRQVLRGFPFIRIDQRPIFEVHIPIAN